MMHRVLLTFLLLFSLGASLHAQENFADDLSGFEEENSLVDTLSDDLDGFGEENTALSDDLNGFSEESISSEQEIQTPPSNLSINGNVAFKTAYGYREHTVDGVEYRGFNQAQTALYLQLDYKINSDWKLRLSGDGFYDAIYDLSAKDYNQDVLDTYKKQLRLDDTYLQGRLTPELDLKLGRQIVVWGKSDSIRITDVINPLDNRLQGMTDIEDLRLSTTMAKLDYYLGSWNFSAMAIAESRIFLEAAPRGEYFPVDAVFANAPTPFIELVEPSSSLEDMQYAFAANGVFSGWDLSFYGADVLDSRWHLEGALPNAKRVVSKIQMLGSALNIAYGSWLLKSEVAYINGLKYNSTQDEKARLDALVGFDYMGISDTVLSLEIANRHIFEYESQMGGLTLGVVPDYIQEDEVQTALRATHSFSNDTLNATLLLSTFGNHWQYGGFFRASLEYDVRDGVVANFGVIDYLDTPLQQDKPFTHAISNNDRLYLDITYSF